MAAATRSKRRQAAAANDVPALVCVLAGNPVTGASVLSCLDTTDTRALRRLHPAVAGAVAGVPWADTVTPVVDAVRWRAALPAAVGARLAEGTRFSDAVVAALAGVTRLDLRYCYNVTDEVLLRLPTTLCTLNVHRCRGLTAHASFAHLTALASLECGCMGAVAACHAGLPPSLQKLQADCTLSFFFYVLTFPAGASLAHLSQLRVLHIPSANLGDDTLASLPPSLIELDIRLCNKLTAAASFTHLPTLQTLNAANSDISNAALACLPLSLVCLDVSACRNLTTAAALPPLPALRLLDVGYTNIGDVLVASLPAALEELRMVSCRSVTGHATLDHVRALRLLCSMGTTLARAVVAGCRARGCVAPAAGELRGHRLDVSALAVLADGRLASGDDKGGVRVWDTAVGGEATAVLRMRGDVCALAALHDDRLAVGGSRGVSGYVEVWDVAGTPPIRTAEKTFDGTVLTLGVLTDGRLAAGCDDGRVRVVDVGAGVVVAELEGHRGGVAALAVLPDGTLVSGFGGGKVFVWDVGRKVCVAAFDMHTNKTSSLAVLADGRLAAGSWGGELALWDKGTRMCMGTMAGYGDRATALTALPDGRLVSAPGCGIIQVWDTRPAAAAAVAASSRAAGTVPMTVLAHLPKAAECDAVFTTTLVPLPDGRLACAQMYDVFLLEVPPPVPYDE